MIFLAAICVLVFFLGLRFILSFYSKRTIAISEYQEAILTELKWMVEQEDVPVQVLEFVAALAKWSASGEATGRLIVALSRPTSRREEPSTISLVRGARDEVQESMKKVIFSFLKVASLRSFFLGWMVFPLVLAEPRKQKANSHSRIGFEGLVLNRLVKRVLPNC